MYSSEINDFLNKGGISVGDKVKIESDDVNIEGEIMPKTEVGNPDTLVIKLENGYNVGIAYSSELRISLLNKRKGKIEFPKAKIRPNKDLPSVELIYTGGTIGSKVDYKTGGVYMLTKPEELLYEVPEVSEIANISISNLFNIASEDMSFHEWQKIAEQAAKSLNKGARGAIVTIGTDTMHYASAALSFMLKNLNAPVVLTGAQRSSDRGSSDAFFNLKAAAKIAASSDIAEVGICMHSSSSDDRCHFIRGTHVRKMHTSRRDAFRPINNRPIAFVDQKLNITYKDDYAKIEARPKEKVEAMTRFESKVALVGIYPNSDPAILDFHVSRGCKGIILEGTGLGHAPVSTIHDELNWLNSIKAAVDAGVVVGMTSQCIYGRVNPNVYRNLRILSTSGVVYCEDMTPETAYVKLGWLLGNYNAERAKDMLNKDIRGEITKRIEFDENFLV
ncbi:MAG: Glu-tRNA(Gln) amidotransferase subunit GatD [Candidatus Micrarchaeota archaeon]|nr:Glu-tRNA(Gln) amidotransferase subunit GatD [Candidatus Micrarchaeota archaeon]